MRRASQVAIVVKNPSANAGDIRDASSVPGLEDPLEEGMAIHSSILVWRIHMDRGAWRAIVHGVTKSQTQQKRLSRHAEAWGRIHCDGGLVTKSCQTLATPWTEARQAPLSMGFSRQEYCSGLPLPSPGDLPDPGIETASPALQADSLPTELWRIHGIASIKYISPCFPGGSVVKNLPALAGDTGLIPDPGRSHMLQSN